MVYEAMRDSYMSEFFTFTLFAYALHKVPQRFQ